MNSRDQCLYPISLKTILVKTMYLTEAGQTVLINGALNCFSQESDYIFEPSKPMDLIDRLRVDFVQINGSLELGDLVVFWNREPGGTWENKKMEISMINPKDEIHPKNHHSYQQFS